MIEATLPLQMAIVALLDADQPLRDLVPGGILDRIPQGTQPPYLFPSGWSQTEAGTECLDAADVDFEIQCVSIAPARDEIAAMAGAVARVLRRARPAIAGLGDVEISYSGTLYFQEPDGVTRRAVVRFRALVDED